MSEPQPEPQPDPGAAEVVVPETVETVGSGAAPDTSESIQSPAKVMRIGSMIKQLLEEVRATQLDEPSRDRLREIYQTSVAELSEAISPDLRDELARLTPPFDATTPTDAELRVAKAQLVGWLEGLFHGIQATLFAQQMSARAQLEEMRRQLGPGTVPGQARPGTPPSPEDTPPGTYL
jgi:hypothetical protein